MPRKFLRKYLPDPMRLREHRHLRFLGRRLTDPNLWHLNRRCVANGAFVGLFFSLLPIPFQMFPAAFCAVAFRANLPLSIALVWLTNPLTAVPVWYGTYRFGSFLLGREPTWQTDSSTLDAAWNSVVANFAQIYVPMFCGSVVLGTALGLGGWLAVHRIWRAHTEHQWRVRARRRRALMDDDRTDD